MKRRQVAEPEPVMPEHLAVFVETDWRDHNPPDDIPAEPWRRMHWRRARRAWTRGDRPD
ncbi:MAG: hypothetical protein U0R68_13400 [Candidatus Nanopelagicales bacterium]